jgi:hypothetical protein
VKQWLQELTLANSGLSGAVAKRVDIVLADGAFLISFIAEILNADSFHHSKDLVLDDILPEGLNDTFGEKYSYRSWMTSVKDQSQSGRLDQGSGRGARTQTPNRRRL